jgi:hypothetical protein
VSLGNGFGDERFRGSRSGKERSESRDETEKSCVIASHAGVGCRMMRKNRMRSLYCEFHQK